MKKFLAVVLIGASLAGCAGDPLGGGTPGAGTTSVADIIQKSQEVAVQICGWAPAGQIIANIIATATPAGAAAVTAAAIGSAVCAAVAPPNHLGRLASKRIVKGWVVTPGAVNGVAVR